MEENVNKKYNKMYNIYKMIDIVQFVFILHIYICIMYTCKVRDQHKINSTTNYIPAVIFDRRKDASSNLLNQLRNM